MDDISLANGALIKAGCSPILTLGDDSTEAEVAAVLLPQKRQHLLSRHPWRFATRQRQLTRSTLDVPLSAFEAAYDLPAGVQRVLGCRVNDQLLDFDRYENAILCDAQEDDAVIADLVVDVAIDFWPAYAAEVLTLELASDFALILAEDTDKAAYLARKAGLEFTSAKTADSQGRTAQRLPLSRFRAFVAGGQR